VLAPLAAIALALATREPMDAQSPALSSPAPSSPEAVARAFFAALEGRRWREAARWLHTAALASFREHALMMARSSLQAELTMTTAEDLLRRDPDMPREAAEYEVRRMSKSMERLRADVLEEAGVGSLEELERLSREEVFTRLMAARDERGLMQRMALEKMDTATAELVARAAPRQVRTVLGSAVGAAPDVAYVTYSASYQGPAFYRMVPARVAVVGMRRDGPGWKVDPGEVVGHELLGGGNFAVAFEAESDPSDLREAVRKTVVWPAEGAPRFRARMEGAGADPIKQPPTTLILERLAPDGAVAARVEVPAEAWSLLGEVVFLWSLLVMDPHEAAH
jgi:hypothetical protein